MSQALEVEVGREERPDRDQGEDQEAGERDRAESFLGVGPQGTQ